MISVSVNNEIKQCEASRGLSELLQDWGFDGEKIAVAINGDFVPRSQYANRQLKAGDQLDVLAPVQGG